MKFFLYIVSILWLAFGFGMLVLPEIMKKVYMAKFAKIKNIKPWGILALAIGLLFILSAKHLWVETFGYAMALIAIFKGLYTLVLKKDKIKEMMEWWWKAPAEFLRIWGLFLISLAFVLLSLIK